MSKIDAAPQGLTLLTIGVFGYDEEGFFSALQEAEVDTFCDIRQRRGVRGSKFSFVNSNRLQQRLAELGIRYVYAKALAPTQEVREAQKRADMQERVAKRERTRLHPAFVAAYQSECLAKADPTEVLASLPADARRVALFCVEEQPSACHRSLAAEWLADHRGVPVEHLTPDR